MKLRPMPGWVALKDLQDLRISDGGLYLPREQNDREHQSKIGTVASVGRKVPGVQAGDRVVVHWSHHREMKSLGKHIRFIPAKKLLGVLG